MTVITPENFAGQFGDLLGQNTFRLELLDFYVAANEDEPFRQFLAGKRPDEAWREPWKSLVRRARAAGKQMSRVHVVSEPLSDYVRFQLVCGYPASVEAGEDVRMLPRHIAETLDLPPHDYWLFDDQVALMEYDEQGNWLNVDLNGDPAVVLVHRNSRDLALRHAIPLTVYLEEEQREPRAS